MQTCWRPAGPDTGPTPPKKKSAAELQEEKRATRQAKQDKINREMVNLAHFENSVRDVQEKRERQANHPPLKMRLVPTVPNDNNPSQRGTSLADIQLINLPD